MDNGREDIALSDLSRRFQLHTSLARWSLLSGEISMAPSAFEKKKMLSQKWIFIED